MSGSTVMVMESASGPVVTLVGTTNDADHVSSCTVSLNMNENGTLTFSKTAAAVWIDGPHNVDWIVPKNSTVGDNYWVKAHLTSGSAVSGTMDTWLQINITRLWSINQPSFGSKTSVLTISIAADSGGASVLASSDFTLVASVS